MKEDVLRVLKMVEEGKIDSQKGAELIDVLNAPKLEEKAVATVNKINFNDERMLRVKVLSAKNDNVNVQLPVKFIKGVLAACGKLPLNIQGMEGIDVQMLLQAMDSGLTGKIVDVKSGEGDIVEVSIE
jgi:hypothetical protein